MKIEKVLNYRWEIGSKEFNKIYFIILFQLEKKKLNDVI